MVNRAILVGSLGRDPEVRTMQNGSRVVSFSLATSEHWRDRASGERKEKTTWHNIVVFNENIGKIAESYLKKGSKAYVEGQIQTREYIDKDGAQRKVTEIVIPMFGGAIELLDGRKEPESVPHEERGRGRPAASNSLSDQLNDDVPW